MNAITGNAGQGTSVKPSPLSGDLPVEAVIVTAELSRRPSRPPDYEAENRALNQLIQGLANSQESPLTNCAGGSVAPPVLQSLVETTKQLCQANACGISLLEDHEGNDVFRLQAVAGESSRVLRNYVPRHESPCQVAIECNQPLLMSRPERHFGYSASDAPPVVELLLVPFHRAGEAIGTLWIISHDDGRKFDAEDLRLMTNVSHFAAMACQCLEDQKQRQLNHLSKALLEGGEPMALYEMALETAMAITNSDFGSIQTVDAGENSFFENQELKLMAWRGFHRDSATFWKRVPFDSSTSCGAALRNRNRYIIEDIEENELIANTPHIVEFRRSGIFSMQSTPLISRSGHLLGVISTHWRKPHRATAIELRTMDILARQVADFIERHRDEMAVRESDRRKDEFLATMAHELRNPLAPIRYALSLMEVSGEEPKSFVKTRQMMERQLKQLVRLIDDLLDISRINQGKIELRKDRVLLRQIVADAVESVKPLIDESGDQLSISLPAEPVYLMADAARLAQVFANLLSNAIKYTERGGKIELSAVAQSEEIVISVVDTGIGISKEHLPHLFELFSQVESALERSKGGLGIGLALVRGLVAGHGGTVEAHSDGLGRGSQFDVRLPIIVAETKSPANIVDGATNSKSPRRILVVDDNRDAVESLSKLLRMKGHDVVVAGDGVAAIAVAATFLPEIALLDIGMPKMNGYEAASELRKQSWGKSMFLVAMTGWGQEDDKRRALAAGFDHHLTKPVDPTALDQLLASPAI